MTKAPKWVNNYPHELDRTALKNLADSIKGRFEDPREMNFVLYGFQNQESLDSACDFLINKGWSVEAGPQSDDPSMLMVVGRKQNYVIDQESYETDVVMFKRIADLYDAKYDGWFASN